MHPTTNPAPTTELRRDLIAAALDALTLAHKRRQHADRVAADWLRAENEAAAAALRVGATYVAIADILGVSDTQARRKIDSTGRPHR